jgi:hypothetical protein
METAEIIICLTVGGYLLTKYVLLGISKLLDAADRAPRHRRPVRRYR